LTINAELIDPTHDSNWDRLVVDDVQGYQHAYHLGAWQEVHRRAYGNNLVYLAAREPNGSLTAGLPLWIRGGWLRTVAAALVPRDDARAGGRGQLVSVFRGGPIGTDLAARAAVLAAACRLVDERGLHGLTITTGVPGCEQLIPGITVKPSNPGWVTPLPSDPDELRRQWRKRSRNLSRSITKAEERGAVVRPVASVADLWCFYRLHVETMRRLRAAPRSWFEIRLAHKVLAPAGRCRVWLVEYRGEPVAGAMFLAAGRTLEPFYIGSDPGADDVRPAHAVYWHAIKWAIACGLTTVYWGAAALDSSLGRFKRQWSAEPVDHFDYTYAPTRNASARPLDAEPINADPPPGQHAPAHDFGVPPSGSRHAPTRTNALTAIWDRVPAAPLGIASTIAHRLM
jgi:Acetyltransferase (GNAT) domain